MPGTVTRYIGRCGVCEGDYKLAGGRLVHHGYRRPGHGSIVGDCFGVGYAPYERSTVACSEYRKSAEDAQARLESYLERLRAGEVRELTVYKTVRGRFGEPPREVPELVRADADDPVERERFRRAHDREISLTRSRVAFWGEEVRRMSRLIDTWVERPIRTVEEFEREASSVLAEQRRQREEERSGKRRVRGEKRAALDQRRSGWEAEKLALMDKYRSLFIAYAAESPPARESARYAWAEMHRAMNRKGYLHFYPRALDVDIALIPLGLARVVDRGGHPYTEYASSYGGGLSPNGNNDGAHTPNGRRVGRRAIRKDETEIELSQAFLDALPWEPDGADYSARDGDYGYMRWTRDDTPTPYSRIRIKRGWRSDAPEGWEWITPTATAEFSPNGGYYVWVVEEDGTPLRGEGPYGPHELAAAESLGRIGATKGRHNRVVTRGLRPEHAGFKLHAEYEAGTGARVL